MNGQIGRRRLFFQHSATSRFVEHSSLIYSFRPPLRPRSRPTFFFLNLVFASMVPRQLQSHAACTHVGKRMTIAPFEFAVDFRRPACHAENCLCSLADAGQTRHTRTRVVKFTLASVGDEDHARQAVLKHPTLCVRSSLFLENG